MSFGQGHRGQRPIAANTDAALVTSIYLPANAQLIQSPHHAAYTASSGTSSSDEN
jgi:hypothetical protein